MTMTRWAWWYTIGGRHFLPYQLHYTPAQLARAYPAAGAFFEAMRRADPGDLFTNTFYARHGRPPAAP